MPVGSTIWATGNVIAGGGDFVENAEDYGGYFTWAMAKTGSGRDNVGNTVSSTGSDGSVCPANWRLPASIEISELIAAGGYKTTYKNVIGTKYYNGLFFPWASHAAGPAIGSAGHYWSSTEFNSSNSYHLYFASGYTYGYLNYNYGNSNYLSVRCVRPK